MNTASAALKAWQELATDIRVKAKAKDDEIHEAGWKLASMVGIGNTMKTLTRQATNRLLEEIEEGILDKDQVIMACVKYMSENDVAEMCRINEFFPEDEEEQSEDE